MSTNKVQTTIMGNALKVTTGVNKTIPVNGRTLDSKTGTYVSFIGKATAKSLQHPFVFVDLNTLETRRHSAEYVANYIG